MIKELCQTIAPHYLWEPLLKHLRAKFHDLTHELFEIRLSEFLKYIFLRSKYGTGFIPVTQEIDAFWHECILQTRAYEQLCYALPGQQFIHHNSIALNDYAEEKSRAATVKNLLEWIPKYTKHFGPFTTMTAPYWMMVSFLQTELNLSLEQINALGSADSTHRPRSKC